MNKLPTNLEYHNVLEKIARVATVPLLNALPERTIKSFMRKSSKDASAVVAKGGTTHALEAMYNRYHRSLFSRGVAQGVSDILWHHIVSQPKALRNRLKIVKHVLYSKTVDLFKNQNRREISILSIAGGSSRSLAYMIQDIKEEGIHGLVHVVTVDKDIAALEVGKKVALELDLQENFEWVHGNASEIKDKFPNQKFDLVEIVGLLDYFDFDRAVRLLGMSRDLLNDGGFIVIANVMHNSEEPFVHKTGWPSMYYRKPEEVREILESSNFKVPSDIMIEPMKVHCIGVGQK